MDPLGPKLTGPKVTGKTVRLPDRVNNKKDNTLKELEILSYLALKYPQYTIKDLYEKIPAKWFPTMIKVAKREEAEILLFLNSIINGPNAKDKSKRNYKKTIEALNKMLK